MTSDLTQVAGQLSGRDREIYARLADQLIPIDPKLPSATQADVPSEWIDEALRIRPDLLPGLRVAIDLAATEDDSGRALERLHAEHPDAFDALGTATAGAYFLNPEVRRLIGYPGQVSIPLREDVETYIDMLAKVVDRGQIYRDVRNEPTAVRPAIAHEGVGS